MRFLSICCRLVATGCMLSPLVCGAQEPAESSDVSWISFQVPGAFETIPSGINDSMVVTGTYTFQGDSFEGGFIRSADGVLTTFSVPTYEVTVPAAINDAGEIAGYYYNNNDQGLTFGGFLRKRDGTIDTFTPNAKDFVYVAGINAHRTIVGSFSGKSATNPVHGFIRRADGEIIRFHVPGSTQTVPVGIDAADQVTGYYLTASSNYYSGFVRSCDGAIRTFDVPGYLETKPASINARGTITGSLLAKDSIDSFLRLRDGAIKTFSIPGEDLLAQSINDRDEVAGYAFASDLAGGFVYHAFLRSKKGAFTEFDFPGGTDTDAISINNSGVITGDYSDGFGAQSFLRVPKSDKLP